MAAKKPAWKAYAAGSEISHFAEFCETFLVQSDDRWEGRPLKLEPWQRRMLGEALAYDADGKPSWNSVVIVAPRKNGKTQMLAAVALYRLLTGVGRPEILLAASSNKQAGNLFDAAARFVRRNPELSRLVRVRDHEGELVREDGEGIVHRVSSDASRLHGFNPTLVVVDELGQFGTPSLRRAYAALTSGGGARSQPQTFSITTPGEASERHDSILGAMLDAGLDSDDVERDGALTICRLHEAHALVWGWEAKTDDPHDVTSILAANPASWITRDFLARQARNPELTAAQFLQLHAAVWASTSSTWIPPEVWASRADRERKIELGSQIVIGFDGSASRDSTCICAVTPDGFVQPIMVWERPDRATSWKVPRQEVTDILERVLSAYEVLELACDPFGWHSEIESWSEMWGAELVVTFPTNSRERMSAACGRFRADVMEGTLTHDGDPVLAKHIGHCVTKLTPYGTVVTKAHPDSPRKSMLLLRRSSLTIARSGMHRIRGRTSLLRSHSYRGGGSDGVRDPREGCRQARQEGAGDAHRAAARRRLNHVQR